MFLQGVFFSLQRFTTSKRKRKFLKLMDYTNNEYIYKSLKISSFMYLHQQNLSQIFKQVQDIDIILLFWEVATILKELSIWVFKSRTS